MRTIFVVTLLVCAVCTIAAFAISDGLIGALAAAAVFSGVVAIVLAICSPFWIEGA